MGGSEKEKTKKKQDSLVANEVMSAILFTILVVNCEGRSNNGVLEKMSKARRVIMVYPWLLEH